MWEQCAMWTFPCPFHRLTGRLVVAIIMLSTCTDGNVGTSALTAADWIWYKSKRSRVSIIHTSMCNWPVVAWSHSFMAGARRRPGNSAKQSRSSDTVCVALRRAFSLIPHASSISKIFLPFSIDPLTIRKQVTSISNITSYRSGSVQFTMAK